MLKILGIELTDFGRHRRINQKLTGNVIGLTGLNGAGKSTILKGIQLAFTGGIADEDALQSFIRTDATAKPPKHAQISIPFSADGKLGRITRKITASATSRELEWDGKKFSSEKAVSEQLFQILGVDKKAINSTVFIKQGEMDSMFGGDVARRDFYTRLLMLGHLAKISDVIDTFRKQKSDSVQDLTAVRDGAQIAYDQAVAQRDEVEAWLAEHPSALVELQELSTLTSLFDVHADAEEAFARAEAARVAMGDTTQMAATMIELTKRIAATENEEAELNTRLNGNTRAARTLSAVGQQLGEMTELKRLTDEQNALRDEETAAKAKLQTLADVPQRIKAADETIALRAEAAKLPPEIEAIEASLVADQARLDKGIAEAEVIRTELTTNRTRLATSRQDLETTLKLKAAAATAMVGPCPCCGSVDPDHGFLARHSAELTEQTDQLSALVSSIENRLAPFDRGIAKLRDAVAANTANLTRLKAALFRCEVLLAGAPTADEAQANLAALRLQQAELSVAEADLRRVRTELSARERTLAGRTWSQERYDELQLASAAASRDLLSFPWGSDDGALLEQIRAGLTAARQRLRSLEQADTALTAAKAGLTAAEDKLQAGLTRAYKLPQLAEAMSPMMTASDVLALCARFQVAQSEHDNAKGKLEGARKAVIFADTNIQQLDNKIAAQEERRKLVADLVLLRDTFKPNGVTLEYLDYEFGRIARLAADYLAESGADFMVAASPDKPLSFEFLRLDKPDETWLPQSKLSGGQRVRLAVAALRAIHALIMPNVGLLVLDEPTTHMDSGAKEAMADMLRRIGQENTLQMIVCDHDPVLIDAFDDEIRIPK